MRKLVICIWVLFWAKCSSCNFYIGAQQDTNLQPLELNRSMLTLEFERTGPKHLLPFQLRPASKPSSDFGSFYVKIQVFCTSNLYFDVMPLGCALSFG